jgi:sn-glycerol 3-phosphate transport system substrate-binding protein
MTSAIAAFRAGEQPHIVQVFEVGTATMMSAANGAIYPVHQLMEDQGIAFDEADYLPGVISYYSDTDGNLLSLPFNSSTPVMWVNLDLSRRTTSRSRPPGMTVWEAAAVLRDAGVAFAARLWLAVLDDDRELLGLARPADRHDGERLCRDRHGADDQQPRGCGPHSGDRGCMVRKVSSPMAAVVATRAACSSTAKAAMWINSSAYFGGLRGRHQDFEFTQAPMPIAADVRGEPQNSIIGGATLWVLTGHEDAEYACAAQFLAFLRAPSSRRTGRRRRVTCRSPWPRPS